jgi:hypothetical protein
VSYLSASSSDYASDDSEIVETLGDYPVTGSFTDHDLFQLSVKRSHSASDIPGASTGDYFSTTSSNSAPSSPVPPPVDLISPSARHSSNIFLKPRPLARRAVAKMKGTSYHAVSKTKTLMVKGAMETAAVGKHVGSKSKAASKGVLATVKRGLTPRSGAKAGTNVVIRKRGSNESVGHLASARKVLEAVDGEAKGKGKRRGKGRGRGKRKARGREWEGGGAEERGGLPQTRSRSLPASVTVRDDEGKEFVRERRGMARVGRARFASFAALTPAVPPFPPPLAAPRGRPPTRPSSTRARSPTRSRPGKTRRTSPPGSSPSSCRRTRRPRASSRTSCSTAASSTRGSSTAARRSLASCPWPSAAREGKPLPTSACSRALSGSRTGARR